MPQLNRYGDEAEEETLPETGERKVRRMLVRLHRLCPPGNILEIALGLMRAFTVDFPPYLMITFPASFPPQRFHPGPSQASA